MEVYKWRHLIENFFCALKEVKCICNAQRQGRQQLRCCHYVGIGCDQFTLNLNAP